MRQIKQKTPTHPTTTKTNQRDKTKPNTIIKQKHNQNKQTEPGKHFIPDTTNMAIAEKIEKTYYRYYEDGAKALRYPAKYNSKHAKKTK